MIRDVNKSTVSLYFNEGQDLPFLSTQAPPSIVIDIYKDTKLLIHIHDHRKGL